MLKIKHKHNEIDALQASREKTGYSTGRELVTTLCLMQSLERPLLLESGSLWPFQTG
jgi:hypothetical protein